MEGKDHLKKSYKSFIELFSIVCSRELEHFILDASFTSAFNYKIKKILDDVNKKDKDSIELSVLFNTQGEVAIIDANIIGDFITNNYSASIEKYYKGIGINKVIKEIVNGKEKVQKDFLMISYNILYKTLEELYKDVKYKKDIADKCVKKYKLENYNKEDLPVIILIVLILEDICKYMSINSELLENSIHKIIS